ncbi:MAG: NUDIX domain-containing protein [Sphingomonadales bacterium]|nr:NUDIX domain-containing protein [Sphingomonadales bacterium]MDE2167986.1 NUDIX domain-containing protein [Sphingomonadales bacterium]
MPVVAAALLDAQGRVLLHRRAPEKHHGLLWEFPGGKVEPGEDAVRAILREIDEELDVRLDAGGLMPVSFAQGAGQPHLILLYACHGWQGDLRAVEWPQAARDAGLGEGIGWFSRRELRVLAQGDAMPPLDRPLALALLRWLEGGAMSGEAAR